MIFDRAAVNRHRWIVFGMILLGSLFVLMAAGSFFILRQHLAEVAPAAADSPRELLGEVDYRLSMGGFTVLAFSLGMLLFFVAVTLDISFRQKAIIALLAQRAQDREQAA